MIKQISDISLECLKAYNALPIGNSNTSNRRRLGHALIYVTNILSDTYCRVISSSMLIHSKSLAGRTTIRNSNPHILLIVYAYVAFLFQGLFRASYLEVEISHQLGRQILAGRHVLRLSRGSTIS